ncbi:MAG: hypothetical protein MUE99_04580 [Chitinophagaceae bacterium]|nr:hypothetical protein [Chitinophagaceae bacterium]
MFGWFSGKEKKPQRRYKDIIWMSTDAKWKALPRLIVEKQTVFVFGWFADTIEKAKKVVSEAHLKIPIQHASDFRDMTASNATVIVLEHHPLLHKEEWILNSSYPKEVLVLSGLDEPLFNYFGGERIVALMQKMGMNETETVEHTLINSSILRAQQKISEKVSGDFSAKSQQEWFRFSGLQNEL